MGSVLLTHVTSAARTCAAAFRWLRAAAMEDQLK